MAGVNKAIILGRLGQDPEVRYNPNGKAMATLSLATSEKWKDKQTGESKSKTEWHRIVAFGPLAEIIGKYVKKGQKVYIEGKLTTRNWQDKQGQDRYTTEIIANELQLLGGGRGDEPNNSQPQGQPEGQPQPTGGFDDFDPDQDIPF